MNHNKKKQIRELSNWKPSFGKYLFSLSTDIHEFAC